MYKNKKSLKTKLIKTIIKDQSISNYIKLTEEDIERMLYKYISFKISISNLKISFSNICFDIIFEDNNELKVCNCSIINNL